MADLVKNTTWIDFEKMDDASVPGRTYIAFRIVELNGKKLLMLPRNVVFTRVHEDMYQVYVNPPYSKEEEKPKKK